MTARQSQLKKIGKEIAYNFSLLSVVKEIAFNHRGLPLSIVKEIAGLIKKYGIHPKKLGINKALLTNYINWFQIQILIFN